MLLKLLKVSCIIRFCSEDVCLSPHTHVVNDNISADCFRLFNLVIHEAFS